MFKCCLWTFTHRFNSAKKDNDFIYHETIPSLETLASVKGNRKKLQYVHRLYAIIVVCMQNCICIEMYFV